MSEALIPIVGMMIPMVIAPTAILAKHASRSRELQHAERIRAMELGLTPSPAGTFWPAALTSIAIGTLVPIGSFGVTLASVLTTDASEEIWFAPVVVSLMALITARKIFSQGQAGASTIQASAFTKPAFDPDAYEFAGNRA